MSTEGKWSQFSRYQDQIVTTDCGLGKVTKVLYDQRQFVGFLVFLFGTEIYLTFKEVKKL